jgi:hypothetical protein
MTYLFSDIFTETMKYIVVLQSFCRLGGPQSRCGHRLDEKFFRLCRVSNLVAPVPL